MIQFLRSLAFNTFFYVNTLLTAIVVSMASFVVPKRVNVDILRIWSRVSLVALRVLGGTKSEIRGLENLPEGGCIIAAKHQSNWDVPALFPVIGDAAFIMKKQLMDMPFIGRATRQVDPIPIDRTKGSQAMKLMMARAKQDVARGRRVFIFVEGTRRPPGAEAKYKYGVAKLYAELGVPVVPVALNSGLFMGRQKFRIWPGTAIAEFLPVIEPGLAPEEFFEKLKDTIEDGSDALLREAVAEHPERAYSAEIGERLALEKPASSQ